MHGAPGRAAFQARPGRCFKRSLPTLPGHLQPSVSSVARVPSGMTGREDAVTLAVGGVRGEPWAPPASTLRGGSRAPLVRRWEGCLQASLQAGDWVWLGAKQPGPHPAAHLSPLPVLCASKPRAAREVPLPREQSRPRVCPCPGPRLGTGSAHSRNSRSWVGRWAGPLLFFLARGSVASCVELTGACWRAGSTQPRRGRTQP